MKAMENKQKAIEKAYGEHWETVKDYVDENGWIDAKKLDWYFMPPRSCVRGENNTWASAEIQLIETNNGWIKIESEADLPKENGAYYIVRSDDFYKNDVQTFIFDNCDSFSKAIWKSCVTHYQPIIKPSPPIY